MPRPNGSPQGRTRSIYDWPIARHRHLYYGGCSQWDETQPEDALEQLSYLPLQNIDCGYTRTELVLLCSWSWIVYVATVSPPSNNGMIRSWHPFGTIGFLFLVKTVSSTMSQFPNSNDNLIPREVNETVINAQSRIPNPWQFRAPPREDWQPTLDISISQDIDMPHIPWEYLNELLHDCQSTLIFDVSLHQIIPVMPVR